MAAANGYPNVLEYVYHTGKFDPIAINNKGETPLEAAARAGCLPVVKFLIETAQVLKIDALNILNPHLNNRRRVRMLVQALLEASAQGHLDVVVYITQTVQPDGLDSIMSYPKKKYLLMKTVMNGQVSLLAFLMSHVSTDPAILSSLFRLAAKKGRIPILKRLLSGHSKHILERDDVCSTVETKLTILGRQYGVALRSPCAG